MSGSRREKTIDLGIVILTVVLSAALSHGRSRGALDLSPEFGAGTWPARTLSLSSPLLFGLTWVVNPITLAATGMLWWRRRWPTAVAVVAAAAASVTPAVVPLVVALFTVAVLKPPRTILTVGLLALLPIPVYFLMHPSVSGGPIAGAVIVAVLIAAAVGWGLFVRSLNERTERAEAEAVLRAQRAQQQAREDIAREMHDVLAHRLSLLSVHAGALEFNSNASAAETARAAAVIRESAHQALEDLQVVLHVLRSPAEDSTGDGTRPPQTGLSEVPDLVEESQSAGMRVDLDIRCAEPGGPTGLAGLTAYRIVQEGLTNARKHAHGSPVRITVEGGPGAGLSLELTNPAAGGTTRDGIPGAGQGLIGLAERVTLAGGRLSHGRTTTGYVLRAWLPWPV
ncbi:sensor histidine kinase [Streptomyces sp. NBC_01190]|uniref:sensor histidine kinase n=1 Tax=Streptomyces sp. NBC_01190 TaxID=2903767 RepID=UPI00386327CE|nr:histidine kinase [Streptomyces sp. NBC_01190]